MTGTGFEGLFWESFRQSRNAMTLVDARRCHVEVNGAYLALLGYQRSELIGRPIYGFVAGGPVYTEREWRILLSRPRFDGAGVLNCADERQVRVQFAGHPEVVTGRKLVLGVALHASRQHRPSNEGSAAGDPSALSARELEVVRLIADGYSGPEIAEELQVVHDTVRTHVRNAMGKLGARSRAQLVAISLGEALTLA
jgi:DNA-binding CsgD family transcriptional regulator